MAFYYVLINAPISTCLTLNRLKSLMFGRETSKLNQPAMFTSQKCTGTSVQLTLGFICHKTNKYSWLINLL